MKLNLLNQVFSFHDFRLVNIENLSDKILLYFDQGIYFKNTSEGPVDYMMENPRLVLHKTDTSFSKEEMGEIIGGIIKAFDSDFDFGDSLDDLDDDLNSGLEIKLYKDGTYRRISLEEFLKLDFEVINESFGYGYMRFSGIITSFKDTSEWQDGSIEIYYNNDAELLYDSLEKL